jgi:hypothetical protein
MSKEPPRKVHLAPMGRYNYPINSKLEDSGRAPLWRAAKLQALREQDSLKSQGRRAQPAKIYLFSQHFYYAYLEI